MGIVMMKKYSVAYFTHGVYTFGSGVTNTHRILQSIESFASGMSYTTVETVSTYPSESEALELNVLYVCPIPPSENLTFDGTIYGNVTVRMNNTRSDMHLYITKIYINIVSVDSAGTEPSLIGGDTNILNSSLDTINSDDTYVVPFWINISKQTVSNSDRIGIRIKLYGYYGGSLGGPENYLTTQLKIDSSTDQTFFEMPVAVAGE